MGLTTQTYDILSRIAIGNGALIYRAVEKATTRQVALKLLVQEGDLDHRLDVDALLADSPRLRKLAGAHVCQLLDAYPDDDGPVLVYEFADGRNGQEQGEKRKLTSAEALDVAAQLISALRSGERQKCPHGDVKPSNIMFVDLPDGRPFLVVLDWGIAAHRSEMPDESLPFLAPERLAGGPVSHVADLFSAGAVLFFLFTGKMLVGGKSAGELRATWQHARPAVLGELRPDLPAKLVQWVCSLLELDPQKRPASAVDAGASLAAMGPPPPPVPPESIRPRPAAPIASGNAKAPAGPISAVRAAPAPVASQARSAAGPAIATVADRASVKSRPNPKGLHPALKVVISSTISALVIFGGWFVLFRDRDPAAVAAKVPENSAPPAPTREAPASVGPSIGLASDRAVAAERAAAAAAKSMAGVKKAPAKHAPKPVAKPSVPKVATASPPKPAPMPASQSPFIAAEGFEYANHPIGGLGGGNGWAGPWTGTAAAVEGASLSDGKSPATGGSLVLPATQQEIVLSRPLGPLAQFVDPVHGGTWYFTFLLRHGGDVPSPGGDIQFNPFNGSDVHDLVKIVATDAGGTMQITLNNEKNPIEVKDTSKPAFIVMRTTLGNPKLGNWDVTAELFVNPEINAQWPPPNARRVTVKLPYAAVPPQLSLLIRKLARTDATTRIEQIRFARRAMDLVSQTPAPPAAGKK